MWEQLEATSIVSRVVRDGEYFMVSLKHNILRPAMGGQDHDTGIITKGDEKAKIVDVINKDGEVFLVLDRELDISEGDEVEVKVDFDRRKKLSIIHTAQHIFYQALLRVVDSLRFESVFLTVKDNSPYGELTVSSNEEIDFDTITKAEIITNDVILKGLDVKEYWIKKEDITDRIRVRETLLERVEKLRIIEVDGFDWSACSGSHVKNTREIYFFKTVNWKKLKFENGYKYKITFIAGPSALSDALTLTNILIHESQIHGFRPENLGGYLKNTKKDLETLNKVKKQFLYIIKETIIKKTSDSESFVIYVEGLKPKDLIKTLKSVKKSIRGNSVICLITNINNEIYFSIMGDKDKVRNVLEKTAKLGGQYWGKGIFHGKLEGSKLGDFKRVLEEVTGHGVVEFMELKGKR